MANGLTGIGEQAKAVWGRLSTKQRGIIGGALVVVVSLLGALLFYTPATNYGVLFSKLAPEDAGEVLEKLKADKVEYKLEADGGTILVPADKVYDLRLSLAQSGLPKGGGVGFEVFDQQSLVTTSFVEQTNYQRALQGELARTISSLKAVESARVHIAMGNRSIFREQDQPPSASVAIQLKPGQELSNEEIRGIVHLVSSSVDGLTPEKVTLLDSRGRLLSANLDDASGVEEQRKLEEGLSRRIEEMLVNVVGVGKVSVNVAAELDYSQTDRTENIYDKDKTAVRSESISQVGGDGQGTIGGLAGARGNLPGAPAPVPTPAPAAPGERSQQTTNYEVSHTITRTIGPKMQIKRLHVAILLDEAAAPKGATSQSTSQSASQPAAWSKEQLAQIEAIARQAAGLNAARGDEIEVRSVPFAVAPAISFEAEEPEKLPSWLPIAGAGLLALIALGFVLRGKKKVEPAKKPATTIQLLPAKLTELEEALPTIEQNKALGLEPALALPSIRERALEMARADAMKASRVLSIWLSEANKEKTEEVKR
jgi:flagellar M-ring protein FliF